MDTNIAAYSQIVSDTGSVVGAVSPQAIAIYVSMLTVVLAIKLIKTKY